jgi:hypothetical protein
MAASAEAMVRADVVMVAHRKGVIARRSEAERIAEHLPHIRDFLAVMAAHPQEVRWLMDGVQLAPLTAINGAARAMAEEDGE